MIGAAAAATAADDRFGGCARYLFLALALALACRHPLLHPHGLPDRHPPLAGSRLAPWLDGPRLAGPRLVPDWSQACPRLFPDGSQACAKLVKECWSHDAPRLVPDSPPHLPLPSMATMICGKGTERLHLTLEVSEGEGARAKKM